MKLPASLTGNPQVLLRKLVRVGGFLFGIILVLVAVKYRHNRQERLKLEMEEQKRALAEQTQKMKEEVNWDEKIKIILPDQEDLLTPTVLPQLIVPPPLVKIAVPKALVYERDRRYIASYELQIATPVSFWATPATAAGIDVSTRLSATLPAIAPPPAKEPLALRKPKIPRGVGQTYILLP